MTDKLTVNRKGKASLAPTIALAATLGLALAFTLSCSSGGDDDGGGNGEGGTDIYAIEDITPSSFTIVGESYSCWENGEMEFPTYKNIVEYSIGGSILSFWGLGFNGKPGNPVPLIGTWTREPFSASCEEDDYRCEDYNITSKVVFTETSVTFARCLGKVGEGKEYPDEDGVLIRSRVIDCGTGEMTKGKETVRISVAGDTWTFTYNGKSNTCKWSEFFSKSKDREACREAHDRAAAEGGYIMGYWTEIRYADWENCTSKNLPAWAN